MAFTWLLFDRESLSDSRKTIQFFQEQSRRPVPIQREATKHFSAYQAHKYGFDINELERKQRQQEDTFYRWYRRGNLDEWIEISTKKSATW